MFFSIYIQGRIIIITCCWNNTPPPSSVLWGGNQMVSHIMLVVHYPDCFTISQSPEAPSPDLAADAVVTR